MKSSVIPALKFLNECFVCDSLTGRLWWKYRPFEHFRNERGWRAFNSRLAGNMAGTEVAGSRGRWMSRVGIDGKYYCTYRIIWTMCNGPIPEGMVIDHIDGNPLNNQIGNLRVCTQSQNAMNSKSKSTNKSGLKGVYLRPNGTWRAVIMKDGVLTYLGAFATPEEAHSRYCDAATKTHGMFARFS